mmetsp:Transcript_7893/g.23742  ORF Transcript_7893/g.23742 Transcript_7893/m.23742 type:complete len:400 (+) Transcript_7893:1379-2578(+)
MIAGWMVVQIVVAVLLENFVSACEDEREKKQKEDFFEAGFSYAKHIMDPLLASLAHFDTNEDLSSRISTLFQVLDSDRAGLLSGTQLRDGLRKLRVKPPIHLSEEDFEEITVGRSLCREDGQLGEEEFHLVMKAQLKLYVQRQMANAMVKINPKDPSQFRTILHSLKVLMVVVYELPYKVSVLASRMSSLADISSLNQNGLKSSMCMTCSDSSSRGCSPLKVECIGPGNGHNDPRPSSSPNVCAHAHESRLRSNKAGSETEHRNDKNTSSPPANDCVPSVNGNQAAKPSRRMSKSAEGDTPEEGEIREGDQLTLEVARAREEVARLREMLANRVSELDDAGQLVFKSRLKRLLQDNDPADAGARMASEMLGGRPFLRQVLGRLGESQPRLVPVLEGLMH